MQLSFIDYHRSFLLVKAWKIFVVVFQLWNSVQQNLYPLHVGFLISKYFLQKKYRLTHCLQILAFFEFIYSDYFRAQQKILWIQWYWGYMYAGNESNHPDHFPKCFMRVFLDCMSTFFHHQHRPVIHCYGGHHFTLLS